MEKKSKKEEEEKKKKNRKRLSSVISLFIGVGVFVFMFWTLGPESLSEIQGQANLIYLLPAAGLAIFSVFLQAFKLKAIIKTHGYKVSFLNCLKYNIASFAISYATPSARVGGEPLKAFMLKKEQGVPYKSGASSATIDKFVDLLGIGILIVVGLVMILFFPEISNNVKWVLFGIAVFSFLLLFFIYYYTIKGKGPFTTLFNLLRFYKIKKFNKFKNFIKQMEKKMENFFSNHNRTFFLAFVLYLGFLTAQVFEFRFILISLGLDVGIFEGVLALLVFGVAGFLPTPGGLGFQEAGHSGLFALLRDSSGVGLVFSLIVRARFMIQAGIGFTIISQFSSSEAIKSFGSKKKAKKKWKKRK